MGVPARTIAVIDDNDRVLESLQNLLASCGYKAETYSSAELFLTSGALSRISCIITDVEMGRMSGLGLLQHVRSRQSEVPVIIITGKSSENSETFYLNRGANGFFRKPIDGDALLTCAATLARQRMIFACDTLEMCEIELRRGGVRPFVRRQMVDTIDSLLYGGEVGVNFQAVDVVDNQPRWVALVKARCHPHWPFS